MLGGYTSNALMAKARAMYGKGLRAEDYAELLKKNSVADVFSYLKNETCYGDTLSPFSENTIHRGQLEGLLNRDAFEMYMRLCKFESICCGGQEKFYDYIVRRIEISQILYCLRLINAKTKDVYIKALPTYFMNYASFDLIALAKTQTVAELLQVIADTPYAKIISGVPVDSDGRIDYGRCEQLLYSYHYKAAVKEAKESFSEDTAKELAESIRTVLRTKNIITIFRLKANFNEDGRAIMARLITEGNSKDIKLYERLCSSESKEDFIKILKELPAYRKYDLKPDSTLEKTLEKAVNDNFKKKIRLSAKTPSVFYSLIYLSETEIKNITTIIEGRRYNTFPKEIESLLVI